MMKFFTVLLIVKACLFAVESSTQPELIIYPNQNHILAPVKERLTLECGCKYCEDFDLNNIKWFDKNGNVIMSNVIKTDMTVKLVFSTPEENHSGTYKCKFLWIYPGIEANIIVDFYVPITFEECPETHDFKLGVTGFIDCRASANPMPRMIWKKDGSPINSEQISVDEFRVTISNVSVEDMGTYSVEASVDETGKSLVRNIHVNVIIPPKIVDIPEEFTVIQGENNTIKCGATGSEPLKYKWYNHYDHDMSEELYSYGHKVDQGVLTISKVTTIVGEYYTCKVSNPAGEDEATVKIKIQRSEICDKDCGDEVHINLLPETKEDLKMICTKFPENTRCMIRDLEVCQAADDDIVRNLYELLAAVEETYCSENTLFHEVLVENLECFRKINTFTASSNLTRKCSMDDPRIMERRVQKIIEALRETGLISFTDYHNIDEKFPVCIKQMYIFACHGLNVEDDCGTVAMYVYLEIIQKIEPFNLGVCRKYFHLIPEIIRILKLEEEKDRIISGASLLQKFH